MRRRFRPESAVSESAAVGPIPEAAIEALARGNKIEAIKLTREMLGFDLKTAKEAVEDYAAGRIREDLAANRMSKDLAAGRSAGSAMERATRNHGEGLMPMEAIEALRRGNKVDAVKALRRKHGTGLKDSLDAVDGYLNSHPALGEAYRHARSPARRRWIFVLFAALAVMMLGMMIVVGAG